jgi:hypothetical protein
MGFGETSHLAIIIGFASVNATDQVPQHLLDGLREVEPLVRD